MRRNWWKILGVLFVGYTIVAGFLTPVPRMNILNETIRNLYFHVPMWFAMMVLLTVSVVYSILYLRKFNIKDDVISSQFAYAGILFSLLGMATGMQWASGTWDSGTPNYFGWTGDVKQKCAAICILIYFAYVILRGGLKDEDKRAKISAVYNIFAYALMIPLLYIIPRSDKVNSLHPGAKGNPAFNQYDLDNTMKLVFYPSVIGWILISLWVANLFTRYRLLELKKENAL
ncbi:MAG: cytochrome c biogenesis protein CcsA [Bacteroidetes bacterium]|nr:cytochrome c biogenesis protein CcsA [Bacteroidota bacterium]